MHNIRTPRYKHCPNFRFFLKENPGSYSFAGITNPNGVRFSVSVPCFTNIAIRNVYKAFVYITDCIPFIKGSRNYGNNTQIVFVFMVNKKIQ